MAAWVDSDNAWNVASSTVESWIKENVKPGTSNSTEFVSQAWQKARYAHEAAQKRVAEIRNQLHEAILEELSAAMVEDVARTEWEALKGK